GLPQLARVDLAADAAVGHRDHGVDLSGHRAGVHVDVAEVVDDRRDPEPGRAAEQMVEQGRLAGPQVAGEDQDREGVTGGAADTGVRYLSPGVRTAGQRRLSGLRFSSKAAMPSFWSSVANSA